MVVTRLDSGYQSLDIEAQESMKDLRLRQWENHATIPPLRGPARRKAARKKQPGHFGRDDN